jgi:hypothetical protein
MQPKSGGGALQNPLVGNQGAQLPTTRASPALTIGGGIGGVIDDPVVTGCWDANAYIASTTPFPVDGPQLGYVANWYSPDCGTNWAETVTTAGLYQSEGFYARITDLATGEQHTYESGINGTYTDMTQSATDTACADGGVIINGVNYGTFVYGACA